QEIIDHTLKTLDTNAIGRLADAADQQSMGAVVEDVVSKFGSLDVLVNNAGIGGPTIEFEEMEGDSALLAMSDQVWDEQLKYNLRTAFSSSHAAMPKLTNGGSIINIASIAALGPAVQLPAYGAAKAGVVHLTKTLAMELAPRRIRVNCICPGLLWTRAWEILTDRMKAKQPELANMTNRQIFESVVADMTPLGGEQTPEDIGHLAVFYASEKARMITGQVVAVDGGISVK
ncbi:MAG: SDR family oxidoreductase, partial [Gammaproteobacteria bacterium]|nr:SDR family oxidoreductase [Gammaproteobacteria bacterium]